VNHALVHKIRKLLRLAKTSGPEAALAAERATALMEKHGIVVTLDDRIRHPVRNVGGVRWREQLLLAVAVRHRCKIMSSTVPGSSEVILAGERSDVDEAFDVYGRLSLDLTAKCVSSWKRFVEEQIALAGQYDESEYAYDVEDQDKAEVIEQLFAVHEVEAAWQDFYLSSAAGALTDKLGPAPKEYAAPPADIRMPQRQREVKKPKVKPEVGLKRLYALIGWRANDLQRRAKANGATASDSVRVLPRSLRLICVRSTLPGSPPLPGPPPTPTRFTYLEFEE
jgi:hypothetical protein